MKVNSKFAVFFAAVAAATTLFTSQVFAADYKVVSNDTLYSIGRLFSESTATIKSDNGLKSDLIYPGQTLKVNAGVYTVKSGDTLYRIARNYGISITSLRKANNKWNDIIKPGQTLIIPKASTATGTVTAPTAYSSTSARVIPVSASDIDLLARLVTAEAGGEPYSAQVGVAAVVINRVQSDEFPNTVSSVVYQVVNGYYQFTPIENGYINKPATDSAKKAVAEALAGSDPSKGALFYFDDSATNKWLWSKPQLAYIGNMVFVA
jgi:spore germination cell wall hydrolase CwlJ-like protein